MPPEIDDPANTCATCGRPTTNPRFCDRSCAAQYNNGMAPKRGPQGSCADCGKAIPTRLKRCEACKALAEAARAREDANIQTLRTIGGELRELPVPSARIYDEVVFDIQFDGGSRLTLEDSCGTFLNRLLGVVFARPPYLRHEDVHRYASLISAFQEHRLVEPGWPIKQQKVTVADLRLKHLDYAIRSWVASTMSEGCHPLLPTFALDAGRFIGAHAGGRSWSRPAWRIKGLVENLDEYRVTHLDDPRLKHEVTSHLKGTLAAVQVPPGYRITLADRQIVLDENATCQFVIERCHLSNGFYDYIHLQVIESSPRLYDVADEFVLRGGLRLSPIPEEEEDYFRRIHHQHPVVELPARWITAVRADDRDSKPRWLEVPRWQP